MTHTTPLDKDELDGNLKSAENQTVNKNLDIDKAIDAIPSECELRKSLVKLKECISSLPYEKRLSVGSEAKALTDRFGKDTNTDMIKNIKLFEVNCLNILAGDHPIRQAAAKAVAVVAITAFVTVIAAMIGFGVGFAMGAWTGPGAFISGVLGGAAVASTVVKASCAVGLTAGALSLVGFYKASSAEKAVREVAASAKEYVDQQSISTIY
jgi:hypothetical protein